MNVLSGRSDTSRIHGSAARLALAASTAVVLLLASLHILSPEFDPSWRMVSEYANGHFGWVLSMMFAIWALSSWALAFAIRSQLRTIPGKIGLVFLVLAGVGEGMASVFDVNHPLHGLSAMIGIPSLAIAAMMISVSLSRTQTWSAAKKMILWIANLTWVSNVLMIGTLALLMSAFAKAGGDTTATVAPNVLPPGVIALAGWANRILIAVYCLWVAAVARKAIQLHNQDS